MINGLSHMIRVTFFFLLSFFFLLLPPPPRSTLFPYTTLFRSMASSTASGMPSKREAKTNRSAAQRKRSTRSEEHTSELQSRGHLVCRLLLEKKKKSDLKPKTRT